MVKSADTCAIQAEERSDLTLVAKSNAMQKSSLDKTTELAQIELEMKN